MRECTRIDPRSRVVGRLSAPDNGLAPAISTSKSVATTEGPAPEVAASSGPPPANASKGPASPMSALEEKKARARAKRKQRVTKVLGVSEEYMATAAVTLVTKAKRKIKGKRQKSSTS